MTLKLITMKRISSSPSKGKLRKINDFFTAKTRPDDEGERTECQQIEDPSTATTCAKSELVPDIFKVTDSKMNDPNTNAILDHTYSNYNVKDAVVPDFKASDTADDDENNSNQPNNGTVESESYYWKNFLTVLAEIQDNDSLCDLFTPEEKSILNAFNSSSPEAQMLYVRLLNRKYTWLKVTAINYPEISSEINLVVNILIDGNYLTTDVSGEDTSFLLNLMAVNEIKALCKSYHLKSVGKKEVLMKSLIDFGKRQKSVRAGAFKDINTVLRERIIKSLGKIVKLSEAPRKLFLRIMMLYSLPLSREMEMDGRIPIFNTISRVKAGLIVYPDYPLKPLKNFFGTHGTLVKFQEALLLEAAINGKLMGKNYDDALLLYEIAMQHFREILAEDSVMEEVMELPLFLRSFTAGHALARALISCVECLRTKKMHSEIIIMHETLLNQCIYLPFHRGKLYDQLALIHHHHMKNINKAIDVLLEGLFDKSLSPVDRLLLSNRALLIINKKNKSEAEIERSSALTSLLSNVQDPLEENITATCISSKIGGSSKMAYMSKSEDGTDQILSSVEETVILHYKQLGFDKGIHAENATSYSIFGIFMWDIIYSIDIDNVYLCPYQSLPLDLKSGEFYQNRKEAVDKRIKEMENEWSLEDMKKHVRKVCSEEKGKVSVVSWRIFEDLDQFEMLMECVGLSVISKICKRMAADFPIARRGFPDIIIWSSSSKKCRFLEVKGPGDRLSPSQVLWLDYLKTSGADAVVCHVKTHGSKSLKRAHDVSLDNTDDLD